MGLAFISSAHVADAETIAQVTEKLLAKSPEAAFRSAIENKDFRLLTIPFCGGVTPGFNFRDYHGKKPEENNLFLSCHALLGDEEMSALKRLEAWVEKYNSQMFSQLNKK